MRWLLLLLCLTVVAAAQDAHFVALNWQPSTTAGVLYNIYRVTGSCPVWAQQLSGTQLAAGVSALQWSDTAVARGAAYCYWITATVPGAESVPSNLSSAVIPTGIVARKALQLVIQ